MANEKRATEASSCLFAPKFGLCQWPEEYSLAQKTLMFTERTRSEVLKLWRLGDISECPPRSEKVEFEAEMNDIATLLEAPKDEVKAVVESLELDRIAAPVEYSTAASLGTSVKLDHLELEIRVGQLEAAVAERDRLVTELMGELEKLKLEVESAPIDPTEIECKGPCHAAKEELSLENIELRRRLYAEIEDRRTNYKKKKRPKWVPPPGHVRIARFLKHGLDREVEALKEGREVMKLPKDFIQYVGRKLRNRIVGGTSS